MLVAVASIVSASVALMVAPVVTSLVGSPEAAQPMLFEARAQDCTDSEGGPRECTDSEDYEICLANVADALAQCLEDNAGGGFVRWWNRQSCRIFGVIDALGCAVQYGHDVLGPSE